MLKNTGTKRINRLMVAIISVILILVTTISYIACFDVFAEGEQDQKQEQTQEQKQEDQDGQKPEAAEEQTQEKNQEQPDGQKPEAAEEQAQGEDAKAKEEQLKVVMTQPGKAPAVSAGSYMVMSGSTSEKVVSKHADRKMQPGKITMLMTAMVAIDNMYNDSELSNTVETGGIIAPMGDTFKEGESATVGDLLNAMLVGGDVQSAELLAKYSASSRKIFVNEMNSKCMQLGLMDTQFVNASGLYDIEQYSTAEDLAVITQAAMRYPLIREALSLKNVTIKASIKKESRDIEFASTDPLLTDDGNTEYGSLIGGMLGTMEAPGKGTQFAAAATKDDMQLIVILMDTDADMAAAEARALLEYGNTKVTRNPIVKKNKLCGYARVKNGAKTRVAGYTETQGFAYVPPEGSDALIQTQVFMFSDIEAPLKKGDKVGEFRIYVADELKGTVDLIIKSNVPVGWYLSKYYISNTATVVLAVLLGLILLLLLRIWHVKRRRAKIREARRRARIRELALRQMEMDADRKRRDWNSTGYDPIAPRATDLRRETQNEVPDDRRRRRRRKK